MTLWYPLTFEQRAPRLYTTVLIVINHQVDSVVFYGGEGGEVKLLWQHRFILVPAGTEWSYNAS